MASAALPTPAGWLAELGAGTEMGDRVRALDWSRTPLGHPDTWSVGLRTAVRICLSSNFPMLVVWGPELIKIYNDGYRQLLGSEKHPAALGAPAREVWPEIWDVIGPMFDSVMATGVPTWDEHQRLVMHRNGYPEECFFTYSYGPLFDDDGSIGGVLDVVTETTEQVLAARRLRSLTEVSRAVIGAQRLTDVGVHAAMALARTRDDVRAVDLYLRAGDELPLVASNRRGEAAPIPAELLEEVAFDGHAVAVGGTAGPDGPADHLVMPLTVAERVGGVLVVTLDPKLPLDDAYRQYLDLVAGTIGSALETAYRHDLEVGEYRTIADTLQDAMLTPITDATTVAARYVPAVGNLSVGGDWYDLVQLDPDRRALIVGDCVGHGLVAATAMGQLRSAARAMLLEGRGPASVLEGLDTFARSVEGAFCATVVCAVVDRSDGTITYSRAGHPPPLVAGPSGPRWLDGPSGPPLAAVAEPARAEHHTAMGDDDVLVLYSDGLVERRDEVLDVGLDRLAGLTCELHPRPVADIADDLLRKLMADGGRDDVVLVVKKLRA